jgi:hypothetical protein
MEVSGEPPRWATRIASAGIGVLLVVAVSPFQETRLVRPALRLLVKAP